MRTVPAVEPQDATTYVELFSTAIRRFQVAAITGGAAAWNAEGSRAMAMLLLETAEKFDAHVSEAKSTTAPRTTTHSAKSNPGKR